MTTARTPNGATIFPGISSDPSYVLNQFLDTDGNYKWTIVDGTVVLQVTPGGVITIPGLSGGLGAGWTHTTGKISPTTTTDQVTIGTATAAGSNILTVSGAASFDSTVAAFSLTVNGGIYVATEIAAPALSSGGHAKFYGDSTSHTLKVSSNGGAYADLLTGTQVGAAITVPGALTVTTVTGTPATFACFDGSNKLVSSATACA